MVDFEPNTADPAPANEKLGSTLKASGFAAAEASAVNDTVFLEKKGPSSFFWVLSDCFVSKTFDVVVAGDVLKIFVVIVAGGALKMFVAIVDGGELKRFVIIAGVVLKMLVVIVELPNDEAPNVILEKVVLVLNTELFDRLTADVAAVIVSFALVVGCVIAEPNKPVPNEEPVPIVVVMVDDDVFGMEFVVVAAVEVVFAALKELPSLFPPNIDVFDKVAFVALPKIFLPVSKLKVGVLKMDAVDVVWPNID